MSNIIKIGIDASRSVDSIQKTGVEKVSDELLKEIVETGNLKLETGQPEFIFYTPKLIPWLPIGNQRILRWPQKFLWTQIRLSFELLIHPPKVFFSPVHTLPFILLFLSFRPKRVATSEVEESLSRIYREGIPRLKEVMGVARDDKTFVYKIIHDIAFKKNPKLYSFWQKFNLNLDLWLAKKVCAKIFVPTEAVKDDLIKYTKISADKVIVIYHGYRAVCHSDRSPSIGEGVAEESLRKKQILYIGRVEEKKNINNLIKAFEIFNKKFPEYKLILAGKIDNNFLCHPGLDPESRNNGVDSSLRGNDRSNIEFLGYVSEQKKYELLRESSCLALISKEEGFSFPFLEAFDFDLPVLASDIPVLREVGGEACLYVNPENPEEIANGLEKIISDENLRQNLIEKGREQLKKFDWQETAKKYLQEILK
jgi:glycosyltransferase involved in cell wall biosynthesis